MPSESKELIESLVVQFRDLLNEHWVELWGYADSSKGAKASLSLAIVPQRAGYSLNSKLSFGIRVSKAISNLVDPSQPELFTKNGAPQKKAAFRRSDALEPG